MYKGLFSFWSPTSASFGNEMRLRLMQPMAAAVLPPCHSQGRLSTGIGAAKSVIELSRTNNWVENSPSELPCPCRVSRLTQQVSSDSGKELGPISHCFPTHQNASPNCTGQAFALGFAPWNQISWLSWCVSWVSSRRELRFTSLLWTSEKKNPWEKLRLFTGSYCKQLFEEQKGEPILVALGRADSSYCGLFLFLNNISIFNFQNKIHN